MLKKKPGNIWFVGGVVAFGIAMLVWLWFLFQFSSQWVKVVTKGRWLLIFGFASLYFGIRRSRKLSALKAEDVLSTDLRPPIIYLRTFSSDADGTKDFRFFRPRLHTAEEHLKKALAEYGPMIAIGRPGERLPQLGSARMYVDEPYWRHEVKTLIRTARLVVVRAGIECIDTENFLWEVKTSLRLLSPEKLILVVPNSKKEFDNFRNRANHLFPCDLPKTESLFGLLSWIKSEVRGVPDGMRCFLYFTDGWNINIWESSFDGVWENLLSSNK